MISSKALLDWKGTPPAPFVTQPVLHVAGVCVKRIGKERTTGFGAPVSPNDPNLSRPFQQVHAGFAKQGVYPNANFSFAVTG